MSKKLIFYIVLIIVILVAIFFSQQAYSGVFGKKLISAATNQASALMAKGSNSAITGIYSKISEEVKNGGETIQNVINESKQKISDAEKNISNYISGISDSILHPGENNNCPTTPPTQTSN